MTKDSLVERIRLGEDSALELKRIEFAGRRVRGPKRDEFADELAAMANGHGGTIVLGVDGRSRRVHGIPLDKLDDIERWVREICSDSVRPALDAGIRKVTVKDTSGQAGPGYPH